MKLNLSKEWLTKRAEQEENAEVSAGVFNLQMLETDQAKHEHALAAQAAQAETENSRLAFGRLINLWRRKKKLRMDELAEKADIDMGELVAIEHDIHYTPEPRTVYQLAKMVGLSVESMLQLSGNSVVRDSMLGHEAVRFAARSESVEKLSKDEQRALEEFVKFLNEK
ncbi:MAG TPA: helix-turn-helix transcriptional regulator [Pyrinomonadaceae bacterium]|jgi:transcriptional regulator with XRE-family HTH domain